MPHKHIVPLPDLLLSPRCKRRRRDLAPLACRVMRGRSDGRALTLSAWASLFLLGMVFVENPSSPLLVLSSFCLFSGLCLIALFDARYFVIPDGPLVFLFLCGLATCLVVTPAETIARLATAGVGFAALRFVAFAYETLRGAPGVGEGDARLFAVAGLWLGFAGLPSCLIYAVFSALVSAAIALRDGSMENTRAPLPFGPHLALGLWVSWTLGPLEFG